MATRRTTHEPDTSAERDTSAEADTPSATEDDPEVWPLAVSTKETDYLGRALVTPGTNSKDYLGRATTATADYLGLLLLDV